jgi:hypothetical protein
MNPKLIVNYKQVYHVKYIKLCNPGEEVKWMINGNVSELLQWRNQSFLLFLDLGFSLDWRLDSRS